MLRVCLGVESKTAQILSLSHPWESQDMAPITWFLSASELRLNHREKGRPKREGTEAKRSTGTDVQTYSIYCKSNSYLGTRTFLTNSLLVASHISNMVSALSCKAETHPRTLIRDQASRSCTERTYPPLQKKYAGLENKADRRDYAFPVRLVDLSKTLPRCLIY